MKYNDFAKIIEKPYFTKQELALRDVSIYNAQFNLWIKNGLIERVKRGFYVFTDRKDKISPFGIAFLLYEPSYITAESALSIYGIIPDITQSVVSVSTKPTRRFTNQYGHFIYHSISVNFFFGHVSKNGTFGKYLLASPEKALIDYVYFHRNELRTKDDILELRINCSVLHEIVDKEKTRQFLLEYRSSSLEGIINLIFATCSPIKN